MARKQRVSTGLCLEVNGHLTRVSGPQRLMERILPLSLLNYVECNGIVETTIFDPVPFRGSILANTAMRKVRRV
jgi:hypothetical protein